VLSRPRLRLRRSLDEIVSFVPAFTEIKDHTVQKGINSSLVRSGPRARAIGGKSMNGIESKENIVMLFVY